MSLETISQQYRLTKVKPVEKTKKDVPVTKDLADLVLLPDVDVKHLAAHIQLRAEKQLIYSSAGPVLLAINPLDSVPLYGDDAMRRYDPSHKDRATAPPHPYQLASTMYSGMRSDGSSQVAVMSGISGSGKSTTARHVWDYLVSRVSGGKSPVAQMLPHAAAVLDSFGNAMTVDNDSSSRYGQLVRLLFPPGLNEADPDAVPTSATIETVQLEVKRVTHAERGERNFHIFYQLLRGYKHLDKEMVQEIKLDARFVEQFDYLNRSECFDDLDDAAQFGKVLASLAALDVRGKRLASLLRGTAAVLHLGNITFQEAGGGQLEVEPSSASAVQHAAHCLGVQPAVLQRLMMGREVQSGTKTLLKSFSLEEARQNRDGLAQLLYERLFGFVVKTINDRLAFRPDEEAGGDGDAKEETVKVAVRCRPLLKMETGDATVVLPDAENGRCAIYNPGTWAPKPPAKLFTFDHVYPPNARQVTVFEEMAQPIIDSVMRGFNGTIFAYGQTGTGKTHTMEGVPSDPELRGIIPRSFDYIFDVIARSSADSTYKVKVTMLEVYNNEVYDLLDPNNTRNKMVVKEDVKKKLFYVEDLSTQTVKNAEDMARWLELGQASRRVGATKMNEGSSRSHCIFSILVKRTHVDATGAKHTKEGKLNMVDLAGSERQKKSEAKGDRFEEAKNINLSLSALGNVIKALVDPKVKHVPFRDSVLTRLLADSLGGNTKTVMIANVGPSHNNFDETMDTLRYADRAKEIKNTPTANEVEEPAAADAGGGPGGAPVQPYLGVLDLYGFERYEDANGFQQLLVNYACERQQRVFNRVMIDSEQQEYLKEALEWEPVRVPECQEVMQLVAGKNLGLFALMETALKSKGTADSLVRSVLKIHKANPVVRLVTDLEGPDGDMFEGLLINHFAGPVRYDCTDFLELDAPRMRSDVAEMLAQSEHQLTRRLVGSSGFRLGKNGEIKRVKEEDLRADLFKKAVGAMLDAIKAERTVAHFVVCLSPNQFRQAEMIDAETLEAQLYAHGVAGYCRIAKHGFRSQVEYKNIQGRFGHLLPWVTNHRDFTEAVFIGFGVDPAGYKLGLTKVFLRPGQQEVLESVLSSKPNLSPDVLKRIRSFLMRRRWARARAGILLLVRLDLWVRRHKALVRFAQSAVAAFAIARTFSWRMARIRHARAATTLQSAVHALFARVHLATKKRALARLQAAWRRGARARQLEAELDARAAARRAAIEKRRRDEEAARLAALARENAKKAEEERKRLEEEARARAAEEARRQEEAERRRQEELERRRREAEELRAEEERAAAEERARRREERRAAKALRAEEAREAAEAAAEEAGGEPMTEERAAALAAAAQALERGEDGVSAAAGAAAAAAAGDGAAVSAASAAAAAAAAAGAALGSEASPAVGADEDEDERADEEDRKADEEDRKGPLDPQVVQALMRAQEEERRLRQQEAAAHKAARLRHVLLTGAKFLKYGRKGNPHIKYVCMNALGNLHWNHEAMDPRKLLPSSSFIKLKDVVKVVKGKGTAVLNRKVAKKASEMLCFSIITHQRSLDLQATTVRERDTWVAALCSAMKDLSQGVIDMIKGTIPSHQTFDARRTQTVRRSNTIQVAASSKNVRPSVSNMGAEAGGGGVAAGLDDTASKLDFLRKNGAQEFLLFQMVGKPKIIFIECVNHTIYWGSKQNPSTRPDSESASLAEVQSVKEGKQTGMFSYRSIDALSPAENCMSLIFRTWTMDLQVSSNDLRNAWFAAFSVAVQQAKQARVSGLGLGGGGGAAGGEGLGSGMGSVRGQGAGGASGTGTMARMKMRRTQSQTLPMGRAAARTPKIPVKWVAEEKEEV